jgi:hypothetical protein
MLILRVWLLNQRLFGSRVERFPFGAVVVNISTPEANLALIKSIRVSMSSEDLFRGNPLASATDLTRSDLVAVIGGAPSGLIILSSKERKNASA